MKVVYYDTYADPEPSNAATEACTSGTNKLPTGVTFGGAVLTATGKSKAAAKTSQESIEELVKTYSLNPSYVMYSGSTTGLNLSHVYMKQTQHPNTTFTNTGIIYSASGVTDVHSTPTHKCNGGAINAGIDARGTIVFSGGACSDESLFSTRSVTLSNAKIKGDINIWQGNLVMSDSTVVGNVAASGVAPYGNILLCPNPVSGNASCTGLTGGASTIGATTGQTAATSSAEAANTVTLATKVEPPSCPGPTKYGGNEITGCVDSNDTAFTVNPPKATPIPTVIPPVSGGTRAQVIALTLWTHAGYTVEPATTCGNGTSSVISDMANATANTVIVANCAVTFPTGTTSVTLKHNIAVIAAKGITINSGFKFNTTGSGHELFLMVPTPTSGSCSTGTYNITFGAGSKQTWLQVEGEEVAPVVQVAQVVPVAGEGRHPSWTPSSSPRVSSRSVRAIPISR